MPATPMSSSANRPALPTIDLANLVPADGFIIQGDAATDQAGRSVDSAGDINGDGFDDLIVGAPDGDDGGDGAGEAYVIFGSGGGTTEFPLDFDLATDINPISGAVITGPFFISATGVGVSSAGDINGDGFDDVIVGTPGVVYGYGAAFVLFGSANGIADIDLAALRPERRIWDSRTLPSQPGRNQRRLGRRRQ